MTYFSHASRIAKHLKAFKCDAEVAQLVEHATENRRVDSSSLSLGTRPIYLGRLAGVAQLVERLLAKEKVRSSNLLARSGNKNGW